MRRILPLLAVAAAAAPSAAPGGAGGGERILVSLVDGRVVTLDAWTGRALGSFAAGGPLITASAPRVSPAAQAVVPGLDGQIYELGGDGGVQVLPYSAAEIAALEAPAMQCAVARNLIGEDGQTTQCGLLVGSRERTIYAVDVETGSVRWARGPRREKTRVERRPPSMRVRRRRGHSPCRN